MSFFKKLKKDIGVQEQDQPKVVLASATATTTNKSKKIKVKNENPTPKEKPEKKKEAKKDSEEWIMPGGQLSVDVYETDKEFCVRAPIAGLEPDEIDVYAEDEMLIIKGERKEEGQEEGKNYFYQECYWGSFSRQIALPENVNAENIKASLRKGVLTVRIPKKAEKKKKRVIISTEE
jgi:HSP20 family protein